MTSLSSWRIVPRRNRLSRVSAAPQQFLTLSAPLQHDSLPPEVALLLPNQDGVRALIPALRTVTIKSNGPLGLGLFLADPFFVVDHRIDAIKQAGITWVTNLPSVTQYDDSIALQLSEVQFNLNRELERLASFKMAGFHIAVTVTDAAGSVEACRIDPEFLIVLPHVGDFGAGFPSFRQRGAAIDAIARATKEVQWTGGIYGLGTAIEAESESLWPDALDGLICRPQVYTQDPH
ncbi:MAG: hypothetical protein CMM81_14700 [Rhodospirillales bacterium]|jgi:predicted TIM-barrel enzyme|uniref:hypothetical protein n=1 Tax=Hwanghaeella sp. 1Z406 TaxID=3402811 RepID=UPI000C972741|nr:hypothetical protein [Rhodospirillales bacterium]|tara:strand:+ start:60771 stop:61472 length:702 start_codon:yes stop_codon:yes gene_type:complete